MKVSHIRGLNIIPIFVIFTLLLQSFLPYSVVLAENDKNDPIAEDVAIKAVTYGEGTIGEEPSFYGNKTEATVNEDKITIPLTKEMTDNLDGNELDPNSMLLVETTDDAILKIEGTEVENYVHGFYIEDYAMEINKEYIVTIEQGETKKQYTMLFEPWKQTEPEVLSVTYGEGTLGNPPSLRCI